MGNSISHLEVLHNIHPVSNMDDQLFRHPKSRDSVAHPSPSPRQSPVLNAANLPLNRKPLIFAAMATVDDANSRVHITTSPSPQPPRRRSPERQSALQSYPSPPAEYPSPPQRSSPLPSQSLGDFGSSYANVRLPGSPEKAPRRNVETRNSSPSNSPWNQPQPLPARESRTPRMDANTQLPPAPQQSQPTSRNAHTPRTAHTQLPPVSNDQAPQPQASPRTKKSSKSGHSSRAHSDVSSMQTHGNGTATTHTSDSHSHHHHHRTLHKQRPITPVSPGPPAKKLGPPFEADFTAAPPVGLALDDDPFAKTEGVKLIKASAKDGSSAKQRTRDDPGASSSSIEGVAIEGAPSVSGDPQYVSPPRQNALGPVTPPSPVSPDDYRSARSRRRGEGLEKSRPSGVSDIPIGRDRPAEPFPLDLYLSDPHLLSSLLAYLSFYDWCILSSVSKRIRLIFIQSNVLKEEVLERYLQTVGYSRWAWDVVEPLPLSLTVSLSRGAFSSPSQCFLQGSP